MLEKLLLYTAYTPVANEGEMTMRMIQAEDIKANFPIAIVQADDYEQASLLTEGVVARLQELEFISEFMQLVNVPSVLSSTMVADALARSGQVAGVIVIGIIVADEDPAPEVHYQETLRAHIQSAVQHQVPVVNGVVVVDTMEEFSNYVNKHPGVVGRDFADECYALVSVVRQIDEG